MNNPLLHFRDSAASVLQRVSRATLPAKAFEWLPEDFASCAWRNLVFLNYPVDPERLRPHVPPGTTLDLWEGKAWISLVGLTFESAKLLELPLPFQQHYAQINLRFYVRRVCGGKSHAGVVFLRELVSKPMLSLAAQILLNERYASASVKGDTSPAEKQKRQSSTDVRYHWESRKGSGQIYFETAKAVEPMAPASFEEFIAHRLWSYTPQRDGSVAELHLRHPRWHVVGARAAWLQVSGLAPFPAEFRDLFEGPPAYSFLAAGSSVTIERVRKLFSH